MAPAHSKHAHAHAEVAVLSMRDEVYMILRRIGFPQEVCDGIIRAGALGGHLPIFSARGKYINDYDGCGLMVDACAHECYFAPCPVVCAIEQFGGNYLENCGRIASIQRAYLNMAYGDYYDEILEEMGMEDMMMDALFRCRDSVSGDENKLYLLDWMKMLLTIEDWMEPASHSTTINDNNRGVGSGTGAVEVFRYLCAQGILRPYEGNMVMWGMSGVQHHYCNPTIQQRAHEYDFDDNDEALIMAVRKQ